MVMNIFSGSHMLRSTVGQYTSTDAYIHLKGGGDLSVKSLVVCLKDTRHPYYNKVIDSCWLHVFIV